jgi:hypothetical protein
MAQSSIWRTGRVLEDFCAGRAAWQISPIAAVGGASIARSRKSSAIMDGVEARQSPTLSLRKNSPVRFGFPGIGRFFYRARY